MDGQFSWQLHSGSLLLEEHSYRLRREEKEQLLQLGSLRTDAHGEREKVVERLPAELGERLIVFAERSAPLGFFIIRGIPQEVCHSSALSFGIVGLLGWPMTIAGHRERELIQEIRPVRKDASSQLGTGSVELALHTEDAHAGVNPDFVALMCVRGDPQVKTLVSRVQPESIDPEMRCALSRAEFLISADESYPEIPLPTAPVPVLAGSSAMPFLRYDPLYTTCLDPHGTEALQQLTRHLEARCTELTLEEGDFLFIDNRCAVHGRSAFIPRYDESDRWVRRIRVVREAVGREMAQ